MDLHKRRNGYEILDVLQPKWLVMGIVIMIITHVLYMNSLFITTVISNATKDHNLVHHNEITTLTP